MVHMEQMFGTDNHYIQDIICALWPVNSGENTGGSLPGEVGGNIGSLHLVQLCVQCKQERATLSPYC